MKFSSSFLFGRISQSMRVAAVLGAATFMSGCVVHVGHYDHDKREHSRQSLSIEAHGVEQLVIESGAGNVEIVGVQGLSQIEVVGDIYAHDEHGRGAKFSLERSGREAVLVGKQKSGYSGYGSSVRVNMQVRVPSHLTLDIDDGSGAIDVADIEGNVFIDDGSGSISLKHIGGEVRIKDGSGGIDVDYVQGRVSIDDSSGSMRVSNVQGKVDIEDGSGVIEVSDVPNEVLIDDGSGGIVVTRVSKLNIIEAGSGAVNISDVDNYSH